MPSVIEELGARYYELVGRIAVVSAELEWELEYAVAMRFKPAHEEARLLLKELGPTRLTEFAEKLWGRGDWRSIAKLIEKRNKYVHSMALYRHPDGKPSIMSRKKPHQEDAPSQQELEKFLGDLVNVTRGVEDFVMNQFIFDEPSEDPKP